MGLRGGAFFTGLVGNWKKANALRIIREAMMEGVGLSEEQWGAALRLLQDITEEDKRRATVQ